MVRSGPVLAFNGLHLVVFAMVGTIASWLATQSERGAQFWYLGLSLFSYGAIDVLGLVLWRAAPLGDRLPVWSARWQRRSPLTAASRLHQASATHSEGQV